VRGEGCGVVVLKRLGDAERDGDRIMAVIRGSAVNQDGASSGLTVPNGKAQAKLMREALRRASVGAEEVSYIEAHGTGTALGDPIEMGALGAVYGERVEPLWVGSVKTNIGHLEAAAGIAGLIKVVLALEHEEIPAHLHFAEPSPHIPWERLRVRIPTQGEQWRRRAGRRRVAGVSSFGFSGTNAHVVVEEGPGAKEGRGECGAPRPYYLLPLSARSKGALEALAGRYVARLQEDEGLRAEDVCQTAGVGRSHFEQRLVVVGETRAELEQGLGSYCESGEEGAGVYLGKGAEEGGRIVFLFSGQGAQYAGMGAELYRTERRFREVIEECEEVLRPYLAKPLREVMYGGAGEQLRETSYTQPALFALEYGLSKVWESWGIRPWAVLGHSVGEYVAACVSGVFEMEEGLKLIAERGWKRSMGERRK
jgi:microcystin synthetase protein McyE